MNPTILFYDLDDPEFLNMVKMVAAQGLTPVLNETPLRTVVENQGVPVLRWENYRPVNLNKMIDEEVIRLSNSFAKVLQNPEAREAFSSPKGCFLNHTGEMFAKTFVGLIGEEVAAIATLKALINYKSVALIVFGWKNTAAERAILLYARKPGIKTLQLANSMYRISEDERLSTDMSRVFADHIAVFRERSRQDLIKAGNTTERISVTGNPVWDQFYHQDTRLNKREARRLLGLDPERPVVIYACSYADGASAMYPVLARKLFSWHRQVLQAVQHCDFDIQLIMRPHSNELLHSTSSENLQHQVDSHYRNWLANQGFTDVHIIRDRKLETFCAADVILPIGSSSIIYEAMLLGCPVVVLPWLDDEWQICGEEDGILLAENEVDLATKIAQLVKNKSYRDEQIKRQRRVFPEINYGHDGKASSRVADLILKMAGTPWHEKTVINNSRLNSEVQTRPDQKPKLRILEIVHDFPPHTISGTELHTLNFSKELQKLGHEVVVMYPENDSAKPLYIFTEDEYDDVQVFKFNLADSNTSDYHNPLFDQPFTEFLENHNFDLIHFQHVYSLSISWIEIAQKRGLPVFLKMDDMFWYCRQLHLVEKNKTACSGPESLDKCYNCMFRINKSPEPETIASGYYYLALRRATLRQVFKQVDFVHTPSQFLKDSCLQNGLENDDFYVVRTGIKPFEINRKKLNFASRKFVTICFLGDIHQRKGFIDFLQAIEEHCANINPNQSTVTLKFQIRGSNFNDAIYHTMLERIEKLHNVNYGGKFTLEDRSEIFSTIDLLVMPSLGENYPFVLREALYAGVPVAATRIAGIPEIVKHGENGFLFEPGDAGSLARLFDEIAANPNKLGKLKTDPEHIRLIVDETSEIEERFLSFTRTTARSSKLTIVDRLFKQGHDLIRTGDTLKGLKVLSEVLEYSPRHTATLELMGDVYHHLGREQEADKMRQLAKRDQ